MEDLLFSTKELDITTLPLDKVNSCYEFLKNFSSDKVIYGINTGFGPMAQWRVDDQYLSDLQYNIIRSHSTGAGEPLSDLYVKSAMIARMGTFLQARSGIHTDVVRLLVEFINRGIYPFIPEHGSVGASGDLVQLAHIALTLIGEGKVHYKGQWRKSDEVLKENNLKPLEIHIREGLSITNGTSVMTGIGVVNQFYAERLLDWATLASVMMNEIASSFDDLMAEELNECRRHQGQQVIALRMRELSKTSKCLQKREHYLYDNSHKEENVFEHKVQAYYSLRCTPQILGPIYETLTNSRKILEEELNSACDNPIIDPDSKNVYHGGNFHGDYISLEEDKVKIAVVRLAMTSERQLNYLFHDRINGILPPFLNMGVLGLNYGMQACQFTATSTTAECQTLAMPNYVHSIPNNNDNQDIVSMGTNSALICKRVIDNTYQVMAIHYIALVQAIDCLKIQNKLAPTSKRIYDVIRSIVPVFVKDTPFYEEIAKVEDYLKNNPLNIK
ncbi:MAG: aromatic amino acid ammonia-lyase [Bacteroidales bacterium]|nr:aromatic amino acid ammonia-lyase [Bacteroidales bacterium]